MFGEFIRFRSQIPIAPVPDQGGLNLTADLLELANLTGRIGHALMREAVAELAFVAHIVIDARNRGCKALIGRADFTGIAADFSAGLVGTTVI